MTREATVARRYAKALLALIPAGDREGIGHELERFRRTLEAHPTLRESLTRPWIKAVDKRAILHAVVDRDGVPPLVRNFLGLLAQKNRIALLPEISKLYRALLDLAAGQVRAEVRTAYALTAGERDRLAQRLGQAVGKTVLVEEVTDPGLMAGFRAQIGSLVLDASLKGRLELMRERLTAWA